MLAHETTRRVSARHSSSSSTRSNQPNIVGVHYRVEKKIGEGSFGVIYLGTNLLNNQQEPRKAEVPQLRDEYRAYRILASLPGIPSAYYYGQETLYNVLCIDLLGPSLEDLFDRCNRKFSIQTVALLAKQMITRVQSVHEKSLIYRDIKPDNFLMGRPHTKNANVVHMVDFGMVKQYRDPKTKQHIPYRERKSLSGTARYMSINTHLGREQSRRDDLESLGHVFMYFLRGSLPWQGLKAANNKQKYEKISETKQLTSIKELCDTFPEQFSMYMKYTRKLAFEETPDYDYIRSLMDDVLKGCNNTDSEAFDWILQSEKLKESKDTSSDLKTDNATKKTLKGSKVKRPTKSGMEGLKDQERSATMSSVLGKTSEAHSKKLEPHPSIDPLAALTHMDSVRMTESNPSPAIKTTTTKDDRTKEKKKGLRKILSFLFCKK